MDGAAPFDKAKVENTGGSRSVPYPKRPVFRTSTNLRTCNPSRLQFTKALFLRWTLGVRSSEDLELARVGG